MAISPALRGISLLLAPLDKVSKTFETRIMAAFQKQKKPSVFYLTGLVVAAYNQVRLTPHDFGGLASGPFEQPGKEDFFNSLL